MGRTRFTLTQMQEDALADYLKRHRISYMDRGTVIARALEVYLWHDVPDQRLVDMITEKKDAKERKRNKTIASKAAKGDKP